MDKDSKPEEKSLEPTPSTSTKDDQQCDTPSYKKMRRGSDPDDKDDEDDGMCEEDMCEDRDNTRSIGKSGLYALAKSENISNNAEIPDLAKWLSNQKQNKITFHKTSNANKEEKKSPRKTFHGGTEHLSSFKQLLESKSSSVLSYPLTCDDCQPSTSVSIATPFSCVQCDRDKDSTSMSALPASLLVNVFQYLSMSDLLCHASRVCRQWYVVSHDPALWRHITLPVASRVSDSVLDWLTSLSDRVLTVNVSDSKHTTFTDDGMIQTLKKCQYIRTLKLARYFVFSDHVFESVGRYCHQLKHLNLDGCFSISDSSIISIGTGCPQLEFLYMSQCNRISDEGMLAVGRGCPKLRHLRIDQCVKVKDVSIEALVAGCPGLEYLHLLACSLTDVGLGQLAKLSRLRMLDISNMTQLSTGCLKEIARCCKQLEVLSVSLNKAIDDECIKAVVQSCLHLKCLSCVACNLTDRTLDYIGRYSRSLERVDVAWCGEITDAGVRNISETCTSLRYLGLMRCGQVSMETVDELIALHPHIHYSNFVLESRKLLQRAREDGHPVAVPPGYNVATETWDK